MYYRKPYPDEFAEYYGAYIERVPEGDLVAFLEDQKTRIIACVESIPESKLDFRYAARKWTTREVVGHMLDMEWVFVYRALRMARGDRTPLAGVDQDEFMSGANFSAYSASDLAAEYGHLRSGAIEMFKHFDADVLSRTGMASGSPFTVRALLFIIAGHAEHHLQVLDEKYLQVTT